MKKILSIIIVSLMLIVISCQNSKRSNFSFSGKVISVSKDGSLVAIDTSTDRIPEVVLTVSVFYDGYKTPIGPQLGSNIVVTCIDGELSTSFKFLYPYCSLNDVDFVKEMYKGAVTLFSHEGFSLRESNGTIRNYTGPHGTELSLGDTAFLLLLENNSLKPFKLN